jgi:hypothetical protein
MVIKLNHLACTRQCQVIAIECAKATLFRAPQEQRSEPCGTFGGKVFVGSVAVGLLAIAFVHAMYDTWCSV